ncbi:tyrosine-type recombinase/integrase [Halorientalis halophila]|uniref:tyrosine-type recombinase/integrase n=1 Tax=Halorientalis halophila TaxID=3108499 RepID=UPI00300B66B1
MQRVRPDATEGDGVTEAPDLSPREARDRWLDKLRVQLREQTVSTYKYRLKLFVEWCESEGYESMRDLSGWDIESYEAHRRSAEPKTISLKNEMQTLRRWFEYLASIGVVEDSLADSVIVPDVPQDHQSNDARLDHHEATALLSYYRETPAQYGTRNHVLLELAWHTGARIGGLRSLDVRDVRCHEFENERDPAYYVEFRNRPEEGTPLKNGPSASRPVALLPEVYAVVDHYLEERRPDKTDDYGRQPLLVSQRGRPSPGTIRDWMYLATLPCNYGPCPHEKEPETCDYTRYSHASKCPSSRSPHKVRTGAITWMRNRGVPVEVVAERVNASVEVIQKHYDVEDPLEEMLNRRASFVSDLSIDPEDTES